MKSALEEDGDADGEGAMKKQKKEKKSKNAIGRIKWAKRKRMQTTTKRQRRETRLKQQGNQHHQLQSCKDNAERLKEALEYLHAWYDSPESWKFKKLAQVTLIKPAFDGTSVSLCCYCWCWQPASTRRRSKAGAGGCRMAQH